VVLIVDAPVLQCKLKKFSEIIVLPLRCTPIQRPSTALQLLQVDKEVAKCIELMVELETAVVTKKQHRWGHSTAD
jgi:hypothetical protein